MRWRDGRRWR